MAKGQRAKLASAVTRARAADIAEFETRCAEVAARREEIAFARSLMQLKSQALVTAIDKHADLAEAPVETINVLAIDGRIIAVVNALETEDMPRQSVSLLQSGKASFKALTTARIQDLHRDNICSAAVRVAAEFLRVLPVDEVEVLMEVDLLDRGSGHIMPQPVLYARITAQALQAVNLTLADPAPLAERLGAHFDWVRKEGFRPLDLAPFNLPAELSDGVAATA